MQIQSIGMLNKHLFFTFTYHLIKLLQMCLWENLSANETHINSFRPFDQESSVKQRALFRTLDIKLLFIPLAYIAVRLPGTLRYFISFAYPGCRIPILHNQTDSMCINESCFNLLYNQELLDLQVYHNCY